MDHNEFKEKLENEDFREGYQFGSTAGFYTGAALTAVSIGLGALAYVGVKKLLSKEAE